MTGILLSPLAPIARGKTGPKIVTSRMLNKGGDVRRERDDRTAPTRSEVPAEERSLQWQTSWACASEKARQMGGTSKAGELKPRRQRATVNALSQVPS